jgi:hypothetical protein
LEEATQEAREVENTGESKAQRDANKSPRPIGPVADRSLVRQERGEGIGLAIVKRLSELLDATVEMTSEPDQGTTVRIVLPRRYPPPPRPPGAAAPSPSGTA